MSETSKILSLDDELDLREVMRVVLNKKLFITLVTLLAVFLSVFYALKLPDIYKSEVTLVAVNDSNLKVSSQIGGLAALAGVELGSAKNDKTGLALQILNSRDFLGKFIEKKDLYVSIVAAKSWDRNSGELIIDSDLYDKDRNEWIRKVNPPFTPKPSIQETLEVFSKLINIDEDKANGVTKITIKHYSPIIAKKWLDDLVAAINEEMRARDLKEAERSIAFLTQQVSTTNAAHMKTLLFSLIEEQTKNVMLAKVRDEYVFSTVDSAQISELKSEPKRALIVIAGALIGLLLSVFIVLVRYAARE